MSERFFVEQPIVDDAAELQGPEVHHLAHVLRARVGDEVTVFDGSGAEFQARIERIDRSRVMLAIVERREIDRELACPLTIGVSLPRGDRQKWLVEKLTELGVTRIVPLLAKRTVAEPGSGAQERLRRATIEAAKQCGRNRLPELAAPSSPADYFSSTPVESARWIAHPGAPTIDLNAMVLPSQHAAGSSSKRESFLAIGPEGGFTDEEVQLALQAGWRQVGLGRRILRIETAAVALASLFALASE
ncbi:MAG: Ribosomal small subunit methyltransferase [Planctomycetota bacterium]|jgi:16S rRNA (uracil1498-N3)-methyltransferase